MIQSLREEEAFQGRKAIKIPETVLESQCKNHGIIRRLYVTDIGFFPKAKFHSRKCPNGSHQHVLIYCKEGSGRCSVAQKEYRIGAGDFIIIPAKTAHAYRADEHVPWTIYWVHFTGDIASAIVQEMLNQVGFKGVLLHKEKAIALFEEIYNQLERGYGRDSLCSASLCMCYFLKTFLFAQKPLSCFGLSQKDPVENVIDYLLRHFDQVLSVEEMASMAHLSLSHFFFLFKCKTGLSPVEFFNQLKVQRAAQYLQFTQMRIKDIAREVGIGDQYYFSRMFAKVMGMSPVAYRKKLKPG